MTQRRDFLKLLGLSSLSGMVLDPDQLLWRPGAVHISIPAIAPTCIGEADILRALRFAGDGIYHVVTIPRFIRVEDKEMIFTRPVSFLVTVVGRDRAIQKLKLED